MATMYFALFNYRCSTYVKLHLSPLESLAQTVHQIKLGRLNQSVQKSDVQPYVHNHFPTAKCWMLGVSIVDPNSGILPDHVHIMSLDHTKMGVKKY